jgi:predicted transcriptional regulator of viral defense system
MYVSDAKIEEAIKLFSEQGGILRTSEAEKAGIHNRTLYYMLDEGYITKMQRGLFKLAGKEPLTNSDLAIVAKKIPKARICLISALDFHGMATEIPHKVHIALPPASRNPRVEHPPIKVFRFSGESLTEGVTRHRTDAVEINVYNPAKTIADCFKFRNRIGLYVAIEALENGINDGKATYSDIIKYANICRVQNVIRPYLETIAHG